MAHRLEELSKEEGEKLTMALQKVLEEFNCEMGIISTIQLLKRIEEPVLSPIQSDGINPEKETE